MASEKTGGETIGQAYIQVMPSVKGFKSELEKEIDPDLSESGKKAGSSFSDSLKTAIKKAGIALAVKEAVDTVASTVKQAISNYAEFETATAQVATIMDTSVMSVEDMQNGIMELSNQMGISTSEIANTAYNAISATGDTANALNLTETAAKLASAGFTDTSSALSILTTAMNAYGLSADEATSISDSMIQVQNLGVTTVAELSQVMGKAIASASAYGVDLGNVESAYVSLTKAGINTAESTTYLSSMLKELGDDGTDVSGIIQNQTGKSFSALMEEGYSLADVLKIVYEAVGEDSNAMMNLWSSAEAGKASNAIISQGLEQFNANLKQVTSSAGTTQTAFETMEDTLTTKLNKLETAWTNLLAGMASGDNVMELTENLISQFDLVADTVIPMIENIADALPELFATIGEKLPKMVGNLLPDFIEACVDLAYNLIANAPTIIAPLIDALPSLIDSIVTRLTSCVPQLAAGIGNMIGELLADLPSMFVNLWNAIPDLMLGLAEGIGGGIRGIIEGITGDDSWSTTMNNINQKISEMTSANEELKSSIESTTQSYNDAVIASQADAQAAETLTAKLFSLIEANDGTTESNREIQTVVDMLNETIPSLGLAWDEATQSINMNKDAIYTHIEALKLEAKQEAAKEYYIASLKEQYEAQELINQAHAEGVELAEQLGVSEQMYNSILADGNVTQAEKKALQDEYGLSVISTGALVQQLMEIYQGEADAMDNLDLATQNVTAAEKNLDTVVAEVSESMAEQTTTTAEATQTVTAATTETAETVTSNMEEIQSAVDSVDPSGAVDTMQTAGADMVEATDNSAEMGDNTAEGMNAMISEINGNLASLGTAFSAIVLKASEKLGAASQFQANLKVYGQKIPTLMASGANASQGTLTQSINNIVSSIENTLSPLQSEMNRIGYYAGAGLANGLSSMWGYVYSAAASLAQAARSGATITLRVHSPSKVFQEIGQFVGEGLAIGMEDSEDTVYEAMSNMTSGMIGAVDGVVNSVNTAASAALSDPVSVEGTITQSVRGTVAAEVSKPNNQNVMEALNSIYAVVAKLTNLSLVMDTGTLVGELAPAMNQEFGTLARMEARR